jgi:hypothetical protein
MASNSSSSAAGVSSKAADFKPVASTSKFAPVVKKEEPAPIEFDEKELERILNAESTTLQREEEVSRLALGLLDEIVLMSMTVCPVLFATYSANVS